MQITKTERNSLDDVGSPQEAVLWEDTFLTSHFSAAKTDIQQFGIMTNDLENVEEM